MRLLLLFPLLNLICLCCTKHVLYKEPEQCAAHPDTIQLSPVERETFSIVCKDTTHARFPFLADILDLYYDYHLTMPNSIDRLEEFVDIIHTAYPEELHYYYLLKEKTLPSLRKHRKQLYFAENECDLQLWMKENNDSILLYNVESKPCCPSSTIPHQEERLAVANRLVYTTPKAFDKENKIILLSKQTSEEFLNRTRTIYKKHKTNREKAVLIEYKVKDELINYCNKEKINNKNKYFQDINGAMKEFCEKYNIHRLILYIYYIDSSSD